MCKALLVALLLTAPTKPDPWLVIPGQRVGPLTSHTRRSDLVHLFGAKNVKDDMQGRGGDSEPEPATIIYPGQPGRELTIFWVWKTADSTRVPPNQTIDSVDLCPGQHTCQWHLENGLSLGSSLKQLEAWNGKSFDLSGFGWDYSGTVADWRGGRLTPLLHTCRRVFVRLDVVEHLSPSQSVDYDRLAGDRLIPSSDPAMQRLNPVAYQITMGLAKEHPCAFK